MQLKKLQEKHSELKIEISKKSQSFLSKRTEELRGWIISKIDYAITNPKTMKKLKGTNPPKYRIRIGDVRVIIILTVSPNGIKILEIGNRGEIYKKLT